MESDVPDKPPKDELGTYLEILTGQGLLEYEKSVFEKLWNLRDIDRDPFKLFLFFRGHLPNVVFIQNTPTYPKLPYIDGHFDTTIGRVAQWSDPEHSSASNTKDEPEQDHTDTTHS